MEIAVEIQTSQKIKRKSTWYKITIYTITKIEISNGSHGNNRNECKIMEGDFR